MIALGVLIAAGADHRKNRRNLENGCRQPPAAAASGGDHRSEDESGAGQCVEVTGQVTPVSPSDVGQSYSGHD